MEVRVRIADLKVKRAREDLRRFRTVHPDRRERIRQRLKLHVFGEDELVETGQRGINRLRRDVEQDRPPA